MIPAAVFAGFALYLGVAIGLALALHGKGYDAPWAWVCASWPVSLPIVGIAILTARITRRLA